MRRCHQATYPRTQKGWCPVRHACGDLGEFLHVDVLSFQSLNFIGCCCRSGNAAITNLKSAYIGFVKVLSFGSEHTLYDTYRRSIIIPVVLTIFVMVSKLPLNLKLTVVEMPYEGLALRWHQALCLVTDISRGATYDSCKCACPFTFSGSEFPCLSCFLRPALGTARCGRFQWASQA